MSELPKPGKIVKTETNDALGFTTLTLSNGVKVALKPTDFKENEIVLKAVSDGDAIWAAKKEEATYLTSRAKKGLIKSFGVTPMSQDGDGIYNVKLGFDGYNDVKTKKWPKGQPNQLIARACESGSSAMIKQPFFREAVQKTKKKAESRMAEVLDEKIKKTGGF